MGSRKGFIREEEGEEEGNSNREEYEWRTLSIWKRERLIFENEKSE